jgi:hypothetical protein
MSTTSDNITKSFELITLTSPAAALSKGTGRDSGVHEETVVDFQPFVSEGNELFSLISHTFDSEEELRELSSKQIVDLKDSLEALKHEKEKIQKVKAKERALAALDLETALIEPSTCDLRCRLEFLNLEDNIEKAADFQKGELYSLLDRQEVYETADRALGVLRFPALKTFEVAQRMFHAGSAIDVSTNVLGTGTYGSVYKGVVNDTACAVKVVSSEEALCEEYEGFQRLLGVPNAIELYVVDPQIKAMCLELAEGGSFASKRQEVSRETFVRVAFEAATALATIHEEGLVHRDFKAENLLLTSDYHVRLADFSTVINIKDFHPIDMKGTVRCFAPEVAASTTQDPQKADVWAFGVFLWEQMKTKECKIPVEMCNFGRHLEEGMPMIFGLGKIAMQLKEGKVNGFSTCNIEDSLDPKRVETFDPDGDVISLIKKCLSYDPALRPNMGNIRDILDQEMKKISQK